MEVFVHRQPQGYLTSELEDVQELEELLANYGPLGDNDEVTVIMSAPWPIIRGLLSNPVLNDIWFNPERIKE